MAKCNFCGEDAGLLRTAHKKCKEAHDSGCARILEIASKAALSRTDLSTLAEEVTNLASQSYVNEQFLQELLARAWQSAAASAIQDDVLSEDTEHALMAYKNYFSLSTELLDANGSYTNMVKAAIIREVLHGNIPQRLQINGTLPFNLQKGESLVWLFQKVHYYETRTRTTYSGGYSGVNLRIAKGVYYRLGGFRGNPVVSTKAVHVDTGLLGVTNKHIYFVGSSKSFRVRYDKIVSFVPYNDGIGIQRDSSSAKPQIFATGDGWFTFNLVTNLAHIMVS